MTDGEVGRGATSCRGRVVDSDAVERVVEDEQALPVSRYRLGAAEGSGVDDAVVVVEVVLADHEVGSRSVAGRHLQVAHHPAITVVRQVHNAVED